MASSLRTGTALALLMAGTGSAHAIAVTPTDDASTLVNNIVGPGITIQGTPSYSNGTEVSQSGTFTDGAESGIEIGQGIVMTSGSAADVDNSNSSDRTSTDTGAAGDSDLGALVGARETNDAAVLEFDFTTDSGELAFDYVFGSEEYNEFGNSDFNDVFGFFLDGENIARISGTDTPVSINSINGGNPLGTDAANAQLYNNNDLDDGGPFFDFEYDGFTDVLTARGTNLGSGTHTIKLAIADTADSDLDSGVFLAAGSFTADAGTEPTPVPVPGTLLLLGAGLAGLGWAGRRGLSDTA